MCRLTAREVKFSIQWGRGVFSSRTSVGAAVASEQSQPIFQRAVSSSSVAAFLTVWTMVTVAAQLSLWETPCCTASCMYMYTIGQHGATAWLQSSVLSTARLQSETAHRLLLLWRGCWFTKGLKSLRTKRGFRCEISFLINDHEPILRTCPLVLYSMYVSVL